MEFMYTLRWSLCTPSDGVYVHPQMEFMYTLRWSLCTLFLLARQWELLQATRVFGVVFVRRLSRANELICAAASLFRDTAPL